MILGRPVLSLLVLMGGRAAVAGVLGYVAAANGWLVLVGALAERVREERHVRFLAVGAAHTMSYAAGAVGGAVLMVRTWRRRGGGGAGATRGRAAADG